MSKAGSPRRALSFFPGAEAAGGERSCSHEHGCDSIPRHSSEGLVGALPPPV